jgi:hypothetical protein
MLESAAGKVLGLISGPLLAQLFTFLASAVAFVWAFQAFLPFADHYLPPTESVGAVFSHFGYARVDWLTAIHAWLIDPSHAAILGLAAFVSGLMAHTSAAPRGFTSQGVGAGIAWILFLASVEGLGLWDSTQLMLVAFAAVIAILFACAYIFRSARYTRDRFWNTLGSNLIYVLIVALLAPLWLPAVVARAYSENEWASWRASVERKSKQ